MRREAVISADGRYRYVLRRLDLELEEGVTPQQGVVTFVMLNPSTADAAKDDATIRRCMGFTRSWGHQHMAVVNLCALRATYPKQLLSVPLSEAVGPLNRTHLNEVLGDGSSELVVCAWGSYVSKHPGLAQLAMSMVRHIEQLGQRPHYLRLSKDGHPAHPLRLPASLTPRPWYNPEFKYKSARAITTKLGWSEPSPSTGAANQLHNLGELQKLR